MMTSSPHALDFFFLAALFLFVAVIDTRVFVPRFRAAVAAGVPHARRRAYRRTIVAQWAVSAVVVAAWIATGRSWRDLGVLPAGGWHTIATTVLIIAAVTFGVVQFKSIAQIMASEETRAKYREKLAPVAYLLPRTTDENRWFLALSITAGICEELLVRGYLVWVFRPFVGLWAAVAISIVAFGLAHAYQGVRGILKTGAVGVAMNAIVLLAGWLVPAMLFHAVIDATSGRLGYLIERESPPAPSAEVLKEPV
jgi:membrane protease YdiL (CAAX protease family)